MLPTLERSSNPGETLVRLSANERDSFTIPTLALRDASFHGSHLHAQTRQKLVRTSDIPPQSTLEGVRYSEGEGGGTIEARWHEALRDTEGIEQEARHVSVHPLAWLRERAALHATQEQQASSLASGPALPASPVLWDRASLASPHWSEYSRYMQSDDALREFLDALCTHGIAFVRDVPVGEKSGEQKPALRSLVERLGSIRRTWYGDLWDVRASLTSHNIAYTNLALGLHMDLVHFESPPRFQFLHSLENDNIAGGASYFVDAFHLAREIAKQDVAMYDTLASVPVTFEYDNGGQHTRWARPTFGHVPQARSSQERWQRLWAVNYSPPFQGAFDPSISASALSAVHAGLGAFAELCDDERNRLTHQLAPGECVIFDNRRVLHARTAFDFADKPSAENSQQRGGRWLKGAYMDGDEVWSKWRVLTRRAASASAAAASTASRA